MTPKEKLDFMNLSSASGISLAIDLDILEQTDFTGLTPEQAFVALHKAKGLQPFLSADGEGGKVVFRAGKEIEL